MPLLPSVSPARLYLPYSLIRSPITATSYRHELTQLHDTGAHAPQNPSRKNKGSMSIPLLLDMSTSPTGVRSPNFVGLYDKVRFNVQRRGSMQRLKMLTQQMGRRKVATIKLDRLRNFSGYWCIFYDFTCILRFALL